LLKLAAEPLRWPAPLLKSAVVLQLSAAPLLKLALELQQLLPALPAGLVVVLRLPPAQQRLA